MGVSVEDVGLVSDHQLVFAKLRGRPSPRRATTYTYRNISEMNLEAFEDSLRRSALFSHPAVSADAFADQLADVVTMELDKLAPVRTGKQRRPKSITSHRRKTLTSSLEEGVETERCASGSEGLPHRLQGGKQTHQRVTPRP